MSRNFRAFVAFWLIAAVSGSAHADDLKFVAKVEANGATKTCDNDISAVGIKPKGRGVFELPLEKPVTLQWNVTNTGDKLLKDVVIHFFVVKEEKVGQSAVPKLDRDVTVEGALTMDFKPKSKQSGEITFRIEARGSYLLRVESIGAASGIDGHEDFTALDLVVK